MNAVKVKSALGGRRDQTIKILSRYGIFIVALLMIVASSFASDVFLTPDNIINVLRQISVFACLAFGETLLIITGGIDLSVGAIACMSGLLSIGAYLSTGSMLLATLVAVAFGAFCGMISGSFISYLGVPPFIATLATNLVLRGCALLYTGGQPIFNVGEFKALGQGYIGPIPIPVVLMATVWLITYVILKHLTLGRKIYAIGGNVEAAAASGIKVPNVLLSTYMIAGAFSGLAGIMLMSRLNSGIPTAATGYELDAIASAVIGGTSMSGGLGTAAGTMIGAVIYGIISNILNLCGVESYVQQIVKGVIILFAVVLDFQSKKKRL